jgi:hypothetical protein
MEVDVFFKLSLDMEPGDDVEKAEDDIAKFIYDSLDTSSISVSNIKVKIIEEIK